MGKKGLYGTLKEAGKEVSNRYSGRMEYFYLTPGSLSLLNPLITQFKKHVKGALLDAGAGRLSYKNILVDYCDSYRSVDIDVRGEPVDAVGDVQVLPLKEQTFDTVFCTQVLEHVPEPQLALDEIYRVLKKGGKAIITVPHLAYLHNEPHDYFRYTRHGLKYMLEKSGFQVEEIIPAGGLLSFLGHIVSTLLVNLTAAIPLVNKLTVFLNKYFVILVTATDNSLERKKVYALNYIVIGRKVP